MLIARVAALGLPALAQVELQDVDVIQRIGIGRDVAADQVALRIVKRRQQGVGRHWIIEARIHAANVAQSLVGGIVVDAIELGEIGVGSVGSAVEIIGGKHNLVIDAIEVE